MTKQEIQSYRRMGIPAPKQRKIAYDFSLYELIEYALCFLLSKINLFGMLSPFGLAYFAAIFPKRKRAAAFLPVCLGIAAAGMELRCVQYLGALVIVGTFAVLMENEFSRHPFLYGLTAGAALFVTGLVYIAFNGFLLYDVLYQLLESILVFASYFVFSKAAIAMRGMEGRTVFEPTETLSLLALCAGVVISLASLPHAAGAAHVLSLVIILAAGLVGGFLMSCTAGVLFGLVNSLFSVLPAQVVAVYAVSALCAGLLQKKGRLGVTLGFLFANSAAMLYFNGSADSIIAFYYVLAAGGILFLIPNRFLSIFGEAVKAPSYYEDSVSRLREIMAERLTAAASAFEGLSSVFCEAVESRVASDMRDPGILFDKTADSVCRDCSLMKYCWQKEYNDTRRHLLTLYERMERRGEATEGDMPEAFRENCIRREAFLETLNKNYDVHKIDMLWAGRIVESRSLVAEQFKNISSVLEHLKKELGDEPADCLRLERRIAAALDRSGIEADNIRVTGTEVTEVRLSVKSCGGERLCNGKIAAVLTGVLGVPMLRMPSVCGEEMCRLTFCEKARYTMDTGFAQTAGESGGVCGDHYICAPSSDGKYILALSDGMGQGAEAEAQSRMTVQLLRRLLAAGFDKETALRLMNSILMVSTQQDSFATADLCLVNLYSGALEFIKSGAGNSYIRHAGTVEKIGCSSLPAGIVCELDADCDLKYAEPGDWIVLMTDGVTDILEQNGGEALLELIQSFDGDTPQELADTILRAALGTVSSAAHDDMTVLCARLIEA